MQSARAQSFLFLVFKRKKYRAFFTFGKATDTLDSFGALVEEKNFVFDKDAMKNALKSLEGVQMQIPPAYSALSVNGVRAYTLARKGVSPDLPPRRV